MKAARLREFEDWFAGYLRPFEGGDEEIRRNTLLKKNHTFRVRTEIIGLGRDLGLPEEDLLLADTLALFHDLGRFEQYFRHRTFVDRDSEDHAVLGVKILEEHQVLDRIDPVERELILKAVSYHNRAVLPDGESSRCLFFTRLLRDADKIDIFKVVTDYYGRKDPSRDRAIELGLPDTPGFSPEVYQALLRKEIVRADRLRNLNDFKLLQVGWVYGLNFSPAFERVRRRGYLDIIRRYLPRTEEIDRIFGMAGDHLLAMS
ncbi:MAG: HD domain-containing protein [Candidatus Erginobacter occultus]|nr:HD domain-containing protein [Candidatus Erginobacter occultus]